MIEDNQYKGNCMMHVDPYRSVLCQPSECRTCGWNKNVCAKRNELIRRKGLTKNGNGKLRLLITRQDLEDMNL